MQLFSSRAWQFPITYSIIFFCNSFSIFSHYSCGYCFLATAYLLSAMTRGSKNFPCNVCGKSYKYKRGLIAHQRYSCGKDPQFECQFCEKRFVEPKSLNGHLALIHKIIVKKHKVRKFPSWHSIFIYRFHVLVSFGFCLFVSSLLFKQ